MRFLGVLSRIMESVRGRNGVQYSNEVNPGLIDGSAWRVYHRFTANTILKFVSTSPFVLNAQVLLLIQGECTLTVYTGGTEGGTFTPIPTNFSKNQALTPPAVSTITVSVGGTHTGGNEREVIPCKAGTGGNAATSEVLGQGERVLPAGTYYMHLVVTGTTSGLWAVEYSTLAAP